MSEPILYKQIAGEIKNDILEGRLGKGDRLPSIRELSIRWNCTAGTIQRAFLELADQNLIESHAGKGTHVVGHPNPGTLKNDSPLWQANLVHQAEEFLLESITQGYSSHDVQQAMDLAMDRWRTIKPIVHKSNMENNLKFSGSHDQVVVWLSNNFPKIVTNGSIDLTFNGSLSGLLQLAEGITDIAGCHLWDAESDQYNDPFINKLFPGKTMAVIHLAKRCLGFILSPGNPKKVYKLQDLTKPNLRLINRQAGSGTRVWFDSMLTRYRINSQGILGYSDEVSTHTEIARLIAESRVDTGIGLQSAAEAYRLEFVPLTEESYELVCFQDFLVNPAMRSLIDWLKNSAVLELTKDFSGYDFAKSGLVRILNC